MKKRNLNSKKMRLLSVGLLASGAVLSVADSAPVVAKENETKDTLDIDEQEPVEVISSTTNVEEPSFATDSTVTSSEEVETSETTDSTTDSSTSSSTTSDSTSSTTSDSTSSTTSDSTSSTTSDSTSSTTSSSSTSSSSTSSSSTSSSSTSSSTATKPSSKPKPNPVKPSQPSGGGATTNNVQGPVQPSTPNYPTTSNVVQGVVTGSDETISVSPNLTTKAFIEKIAEDAREIAGTNDLYASVMIAQAILESASGNSTLASAPNYNLFGVKGSYEGASASFLTSEDDGSGSMYTVRSDFRKYPSYKESLEDYVKLLRGGTDFNNTFYAGTWKSNTESYKDATKFLTGKYATDTSYAGKLNGLISAYDLTEYDELKDKTAEKKNTSVTNLDQKVQKKDEKQEKDAAFINHVVKKGESLKSISELYNISTLAILEKNQLDRRMLFIGQTLKIPKQDVTTDELSKEEVVDRSFEMAQKLSSAFSGNSRKTETKKSTKESSVPSSSTSVSESKTSQSDTTVSSSSVIESGTSSESSVRSSDSSVIESEKSESSATVSSSSAVRNRMSGSSETSESSSNSSVEKNSTTESTEADSTSSTKERSTTDSSSAKSTSSTDEKEATNSSDYEVSATRKKTKNTYEVKENDTLASISKKTGVSIWSLKEWNDLDQYFLTEGQLLVLNPTYKLNV